MGDLIAELLERVLGVKVVVKTDLTSSVFLSIRANDLACRSRTLLTDQGVSIFILRVRRCARGLILGVN